MMPFTLNVLRLMRDYNGRILSAVPSGAHAPFGHRASEGLSYETCIRNISHREQSVVIKFSYTDSRKRFHNFVSKK